MRRLGLRIGRVREEGGEVVEVFVVVVVEVEGVTAPGGTRPGRRGKFDSGLLLLRAADRSINKPALKTVGTLDKPFANRIKYQ